MQNLICAPPEVSDHRADRNGATPTSARTPTIQAEAQSESAVCEERLVGGFHFLIVLQAQPGALQGCVASS